MIYLYVKPIIASSFKQVQWDIICILAVNVCAFYWQYLEWRQSSDFDKLDLISLTGAIIENVKY